MPHVRSHETSGQPEHQPCTIMPPNPHSMDVPLVPDFLPNLGRTLLCWCNCLGVGPLTHSPPWIYPCIEESLFRDNFFSEIWISLSVKLGCHPSSEWVVMHCLFSPSLFSYMTTWGKFKWIPSIAVLCPFQTVKLYPGDHGSGYKQRSKHHRVMYCMADRNRLFPANKKSKMCWNGTQTEELSASCSHSLRLNWSKDEFQRHLCAQLDSLLLFIGFSSH